MPPTLASDLRLARPPRRSGVLGLVVACALAWLPRARAELRLLEVLADDQPRALTPQGTIRVSASTRSLTIRVGADQAGNTVPVRLRYRLEGYDEAWREASADVRVLLRFFGASGELVGTAPVHIGGQSPGWRSNVREARFLPHHCEAVAPERATQVGVSFLTQPAEALGLVAIDAVRLRVGAAAASGTRETEWRTDSGTDLKEPFGVPDAWMRLGPQARLAQLSWRGPDRTRPVLLLRDDDPNGLGSWSVKQQRLAPVHPGEPVALDWEMAHSVGRAGPLAAVYPQLKPGRYWFHVAVARINGDATGEEYSLLIDVVAPFYQRWEFCLAAIAVMAGAGVGARQLSLRRRVQHRLVELEHERAVERERARIARDLHDDIGAGLTEIAMQSDWVRRDINATADPETLRRIQRVAASAVELTRSVDEIVWAVNPANDTLERFANYLAQAAKQSADAAGLRLRLEIPLVLPAMTLPGRVRHCLFLAVREALNNVAKHAHADLVRVELLLQDQTIAVIVEDNGVGFDPRAAAPPGTREGLDGMRRRLEEIKGECHVRSEPGHGTRVELRVRGGEAGGGPS